MKKMDWLITAIGIILLGAGLYMVKTFDNVHGIFLTLPYILVGCGCGIFGYGMSNMISKKAISMDADLQKKLAIEEKDERNIAIANRAKAKAYDCMTFVFGILLLIFALMNIDLAATLLLGVAYLFVHICGIYFRFKYEKEM